jgi:hypothetical protein
VRRAPGRELRDEIATESVPPLGKIIPGPFRELVVQALVPEIAQQMDGQRCDPPNRDVPDRRSTAYELSKGCDCGFVTGAIAGQQCGVGETERAEIGGGQRDDDSVLGAELVVLVLDSLGHRVVGMLLLPQPPDDERAQLEEAAAKQKRGHARSNDE